jgi:hypothetical protein
MNLGAIRPAPILDNKGGAGRGQLLLNLSRAFMKRPSSPVGNAGRSDQIVPPSSCVGPRCKNDPSLKEMVGWEACAKEYSSASTWRKWS